MKRTCFMLTFLTRGMFTNQCCDDESERWTAQNIFSDSLWVFRSASAVEEENDQDNSELQELNKRLQH